MNSSNSSLELYPYQECLIPNLPVETQHQVRDIANYIVRPVGMLVAVISFVCNALVCITVARTKSLQKPPLLMLCSLAITDLIYSPLSFIRDIELITLEHMCPVASNSNSVAVILTTPCLFATLGNLAIISRDRYLAVKKPWWYRNHVTKSRAIKIICAQWAISCLAAFSIRFSKMLESELFSRIGKIVPLFYYSLCFFVIISCYLGLFFKKNPSEQGHEIRAMVKREKQIANTVGLILLVLLLTFLPGLLFPLVLFATGSKSIWPVV